MNSKVAGLQSEKYISLETFRKNGAGVKTPVWFAVGENGEIYVYTEAESGKVKRIRNNSKVRIAVSDIRGNVKGEWMDASARILSEDSPEYQVANKLLDRKYWLKWIFNWASKLRAHKRAGIAIQVQ
jgi:uncharacterized protein